MSRYLIFVALRTGVVEGLVAARYVAGRRRVGGRSVVRTGEAMQKY